MCDWQPCILRFRDISKNDFEKFIQRFQFKQIDQKHYTSDIIYCIKVSPILVMFLAYK